MTTWRVGVWIALAGAAGGWVAALWTLRTPQHLLVEWVLGSLAVGTILLVGGARAAGAALVGSSVLSFLAYLLRGYHGGDHLETLVHGAVILGSRPDRVRSRRGRLRRPHPPGSIPRCAGPGSRHRYRRDVADPPDPRGGSIHLLLLPGVRRSLGPDVACVQRRLPRGAVPGASVASVAVVGGARRGPLPGLVGRSFRSWRVAVLTEARPLSEA